MFYAEEEQVLRQRQLFFRCCYVASLFVMQRQVIIIPDDMQRQFVIKYEDMQRQFVIKLSVIDDMQ